MKSANIYLDIKENITKHLEMLKTFGFSEFEEEQLAYEMHFKTHNQYVDLDIWFEATFSTPIWVKIGTYNIENLEPENEIFKNCNSALKENYDANFEQYLKTGKKRYLTEISKQYLLNGKEINDKYIEEVGNVLKRYQDTVLKGNLEQLACNTQLMIDKNEEIKRQERIAKGIYTLEFDIWSVGEFQCYEEFTSIEDAENYLNSDPEITTYRLFDCYGNKIAIERKKL
nr:hypothetical protein [uncultured Flavobacterium sp.]